MATIRKIDAINPIPNADAIEVATVGGWKVVVKKGDYTVGDLAVYCEIDSFIPTAIAPFLTKPEHYPKTFEGVEGERLRTVKLRGQVSQGLLLPSSIFGHTIPNYFNESNRWAIGLVSDEGDNFSEFLFEGEDVSERLGIVKWEPPTEFLAADAKGMFPSQIPKTDQERIQNLSSELAEWNTENLSWEVTEKLDGSSMTVYVLDGEVGVCSRNLDLKRNPDNSLWRAAIKHGLEEKLIALGRNIAIQGELIGNGIQGNKYKMRDQDFYVYDMYDIDAGRYFTPSERAELTKEFGLNHCPVLHTATELLISVDSLLSLAEGKSVMGLIGCEREGLVYKCNERQVSFKAISNKFLLKGGD
jgi:hypothetical protein